MIKEMMIRCNLKFKEGIIFLMLISASLVWVVFLAALSPLRLVRIMKDKLALRSFVV